MEIAGLRKLVEGAKEAVRPFANEAESWWDGTDGRCHPGITEPRYKQAHAKAEFSIGDLRHAAAWLSRLEEMK